MLFVGVVVKLAVLVSVQPQCPCANPMICSMKFKKDVYLKNVALDFLLLVLKLYPIQVVISLPLWIKFIIGQLLLFFCAIPAAFLAYVGGVLRTILFGYSANYNTQEHLRYSFLFVMIFWTTSEALVPWP